MRQPDYSRGGLSCGPARLHRPPHCPDPAREPRHKHKGAGGCATSQPPARGLLAVMEIGVAPARRGGRGRATTRPHQPTSPTPTYLTTSKRVRVQVSHPGKKRSDTFFGQFFFIDDLNAARCQLSIALGFVMWLQVLTEIAPCQVAIRAFLRTSGRVPRACP